MDEAVKAKSLCKLTFSQIAQRVGYTKTVLMQEQKAHGKEDIVRWFAQIKSATEKDKARVLQPVHLLNEPPVKVHQVDILPLVPNLREKCMFSLGWVLRGVPLAKIS